MFITFKFVDYFLIFQSILCIYVHIYIINITLISWWMLQCFLKLQSHVIFPHSFLDSSFCQIDSFDVQYVNIPVIYQCNALCSFSIGINFQEYIYLLLLLLLHFSTWEQSIWTYICLKTYLRHFDSRFFFTFLSINFFIQCIEICFEDQTICIYH